MPCPPEIVIPPVGRCTRCRHEYHPSDGDAGVCPECRGEVVYVDTGGRYGRSSFLGCKTGRLRGEFYALVTRRRAGDRKPLAGE